MILRYFPKFFSEYLRYMIIISVIFSVLRDTVAIYQRNSKHFSKNSAKVWFFLIKYVKRKVQVISKIHVLILIFGPTVAFFRDNAIYFLENSDFLG